LALKFPMAAQLIDGRAMASGLRRELAERVRKLAAKGVKPGLGVILAGNNPASRIYVQKKEEACAEVGIQSVHHDLPATSTEKEILKLVERLNADRTVHGILLQLPLPEGVDERKVIDSIAPEKDVDGFTTGNAGRLFTGKKSVTPCTPKGILKLIDSTGVDLKGKHAVVIGRSNIVGKPVALLLLERHATVTICHSRTKDLGEATRQADVLVVAVGKAGLVDQSMVKRGAVVIDVGMNRLPDGRVVGDCNPDVREAAGWLTPVPGGVGPMTVACLMENTVEAFLLAQKALGKVAGKPAEAAERGLHGKD